MRKKLHKKMLFIEGTSDTSNGVLSQGFNKLLKQKLEGNMPKINMADGKNHAITKFKNNKISEKGYLLIDLDNVEESKDLEITNNSLSSYRAFTFFMIQEMESWFLSQPAILDKYYNMDLSSKIPKKHAKEIPNPAEFLEDLTKSSTKGKYHKVNHGTALLELLDATKLASDFKDFGDLVQKLSED